jgi:hypothetical protein
MRIALILLCAATCYGQVWPFLGPGGRAANSGGGGGGSAEPVQGKLCNQGSSHTTSDCALDSAVSVGDLVVAIMRWDNSGSNRTLTFSQQAGTAVCTMTQLVDTPRTGSGSQAMTAGYCFVTGSGTLTIRGTLSSSSGFSDMSVSTYTGWSALDTASAACSSSGCSVNATPCASGTTGVLTSATSLVIGYCGLWDNTEAWANTGNFLYRSIASSSTLGVFSYTSSSTTPVAFSYATLADKFTSLVAVFR